MMSSGIDTGTALALSSGRGGMFGGDGVIGGLLLGGLLNGNGGLLGGNRGYVGGPAASAVATDVVLTPQLNGIQQQIQTLSSEISTTGIQNSINNLESTANANMLALNNGVRDNANIYLQGNANLATAQANGNFTTLNSINGLGRDIVSQANNQALQQLNSFNLLNTTNLQGFNEVSRDMATATNQLIMGQNAQNAMIAQCCCEIKQTITNDGSATRALINDIESQRKNVEISDLKSQVSNLNQTNILNANNALQTQTILTHLIPFMSATAPTARVA